MIEDFQLVLQQSHLLWEAYLGLPDQERLAVESRAIMVYGTDEDIPDKPLIEILDKPKRSKS